MINPYLSNGFSHHYQLGEFTVIFRGVRSDFYLLFHFSMKFLCANRIGPDGTPRSAASHRGYAVCLCPTKGTPGLNELKLSFIQNPRNRNASIIHVSLRELDLLASAVRTIYRQNERTHGHNGNERTGGFQWCCA